MGLMVSFVSEYLKRNYAPDYSQYVSQIEAIMNWFNSRSIFLESRSMIMTLHSSLRKFYEVRNIRCLGEARCRFQGGKSKSDHPGFFETLLEYENENPKSIRKTPFGVSGKEWKKYPKNERQLGKIQ